MVTMSPKLPSPAAFRLLADLNEFLALPKKDREASFVAYMTAVEGHQASLETIREQENEAAADRDLANTVLHQARASADEMRQEAEKKAANTVEAATEQAAHVNETARQNVAAASQNVKEAERDALARGEGLTEREEVVTLREGAVKVRETEAETMFADAESTKAEYETLMRDINAVRSRAPA